VGPCGLLEGAGVISGESGIVQSGEEGTASATGPKGIDSKV